MKVGITWAEDECICLLTKQQLEDIPGLISATNLHLIRQALPSAEARLNPGVARNQQPRKHNFTKPAPVRPESSVLSGWTRDVRLLWDEPSSSLFSVRLSCLTWIQEPPGTAPWSPVSRSAWSLVLSRGLWEFDYLMGFFMNDRENKSLKCCVLTNRSSCLPIKPHSRTT